MGVAVGGRGGIAICDRLYGRVVLQAVWSCMRFFFILSLRLSVRVYRGCVLRLATKSARASEGLLFLSVGYLLALCNRREGCFHSLAKILN